VLRTEVQQEELVQAFFGSTSEADAYRAAQKEGKSWLEAHFLREPAVLAPNPADQVTTRPVALLVGPRCASSCDDLATAFASDGLGPVVGRQTAHILTTTRLPLPVVDEEGSSLGTLQVALSYSTRGEDPRSVEGAPLKLTKTLPRRFAERANDDALHVDAAIEALQAWSHQSGLGTPAKPPARRP
jgi:hypothetical protein